MPPNDPALDALALAEIEEAAGELHRRIAASLRAIGEPRADTPDADGVTPRREVASLAATLELAGLVLGAVASGAPAAVARIDRHPALVAAVMYAAPSVSSLLVRVDQDRRLVASLARTLESRLDEEHETPWGVQRLRRVLVDVLLGEGARCAMALEARLAETSA
ncbi:MAG: hypothetical protein F4Z08_09405 [Chloroflexi bacterium]|nr:hypothetical protein [Chloroflexota bacterium]